MATGLTRIRYSLPGKFPIRTEPFRLFYLLAACDAILGFVLATPGTAAGTDHQGILLFGTVPAVLAGFLLTALPRWTGCKPVSPAITIGFVALWLAMRIAYFFVGVSLANGLSSLFLLALAAVLAWHVLTARDARNYVVAALLFLFSMAPILSLVADQLAMRLAVAVLAALMIIIAGRVIPALSAAGLDEEYCETVVGTERMAATTATMALTCWLFLPELVWTGYACLLAAFAQLIRLWSWRGWRTVTVPSVLFLHLAYLWIPAGFVYLAWHVFDPFALTMSAAIHPWTAGAFGSLSIAIMGSMIRRRTEITFQVPILEYYAYGLVSIAALTRLLPANAVLDGGELMDVAAIAWVGAFCAFLFANFTALLPFDNARKR